MLQWVVENQLNDGNLPNEYLMVDLLTFMMNDWIPNLEVGGKKR